MDQGFELNPIKKRGAKPAQVSPPQRIARFFAGLIRMFDIKKGPFFGLFCRKQGFRAKENDTCHTHFHGLLGLSLFQPVAPQAEAPCRTLQKKSCQKHYGRFFVHAGMCLNSPMYVEMTCREEGCGRGAHAPPRAVVGASPTTSRGLLKPDTQDQPARAPVGCTRRRVRSPTHQSNLIKVIFADQSDGPQSDFHAGGAGQIVNYPLSFSTQTRLRQHGLI